MMTDEQLAAIAARTDAATPGPWYTVDQPWRATWYNKDAGLYERLPTYVVAGNPDPHIGRPVCDSIELDEGTDDERERHVDQSDADLDFIAHSRTDVPELLKHIAEQAKEIERLKKICDELVGEEGMHIDD